MKREEILTILDTFRKATPVKLRTSQCPTFYVFGGHCDFCATIFPDWARIYYKPERKSRKVMTYPEATLLHSVYPRYITKACCPCLILGRDVVKAKIHREFWIDLETWELEYTRRSPKCPI